jgi:hypothetical protein
MDTKQKKFLIQMFFLSNNLETSVYNSELFHTFF